MGAEEDEGGETKPAETSGANEKTSLVEEPEYGTGGLCYQHRMLSM